jgi:hypothetical protein
VNARAKRRRLERASTDEVSAEHDCWAAARADFVDVDSSRVLIRFFELLDQWDVEANEDDKEM